MEMEGHLGVAQEGAILVLQRSVVQLELLAGVGVQDSAQQHETLEVMLSLSTLFTFLSRSVRCLVSRLSKVCLDKYMIGNLICLNRSKIAFLDLRDQMHQ